MPESDRSSTMTEQAVQQALQERGLDWTLEDGQLRKTAKGRNFAASLAYVNRVGELAEELDHHPDISISWNTVRLSLVTHSAGGITPMDLELASRIDGLGPPSS
jgi:4a-hydroxytetrahydrobiopterin dehydratase